MARDQVTLWPRVTRASRRMEKQPYVILWV